MGKVFFDDCCIGDCATSPARTITEADVVMFAALSSDWHPVHTDALFAETTEFRERIAHGTLTFAASTGLMFQTGGAVFPERLLAFVGVERMRFAHPVRFGDTIRVEIETLDLQPMGKKSGLMTIRIRVLNQCDYTVLTGRLKLSVARRPYGE
jgi:3-hydroxybutyryl-CoA dehydratase